ncbi:hypothetical protein CTI14_11005 [Methylobacterium radiotolerans]|nr:hypothetical protein CTI14_11005 [Methylobacterium radiotolerans]
MNDDGGKFRMPFTPALASAVSGLLGMFRGNSEEAHVHLLLLHERETFHSGEEVDILHDYTTPFFRKFMYSVTF